MYIICNFLNGKIQRWCYSFYLFMYLFSFLIWFCKNIKRRRRRTLFTIPILGKLLNYFCPYILAIWSLNLWLQRDPIKFYKLIICYFWCCWKMRFSFFFQGWTTSIERWRRAFYTVFFLWRRIRIFVGIVTKKLLEYSTWC